MDNSDKHVYGGDLETDNDGKTAWMVQWCISDGVHEGFGCKWEQFEDELAFLIKKADAYLYFHNLNYDWEFMQYTIKTFCEKHDMKIVPTVRNGRVITVRLEPNEEGNPTFKHKLSIRDSMAKMPGNLRSLAKTVGLEKLEGPEFVQGWSWNTNFDDDEEWKYICMDARIVAVAMKAMHRMGYTKATSSGDAWSHAKKMIGRAPDGKRYKDNKQWNVLFPHLPVQLDMELRRAYTGGLNISEHKGLCEGELQHDDVNSMYPTVMTYDPLPIGLPTISNEPPKDGSLFIADVSIKLWLKDGMIPWFSFKSGMDNIAEGIEHGDTVEATRLFHEMMLTNIDIELLSQWYEIEFDTSYNSKYYIFSQRTGVFKDYIQDFTKQKQASEKGSLPYVKAKLMMNGLYGRFGLSPECEDSTLVWEDDMLVWDNTPKLNDDNDAYVPFAIFTTAYARRRLLENVMAVGPGNVIHCDTDSVIHYGKKADGIHYGKALGEWDIEHEPIRIWEGGFKRYIEQLSPVIRTHKDYNMACAGVPNHCNHLGVPIGMWVELLDDPQIIATYHTLGNEHYCIKSEWLRKEYTDHGMNPDDVNTMKLIPIKVPGGIILQEREHKLSDNITWRMRR